LAPADSGPVAAAVLLVNAQVADIFNGVFEKQKSSKNEQKNAKIRANLRCRSAIYHERIKHDAALREANVLVTGLPAAARSAYSLSEWGTL
jgi:hypothetical protein